MSSRTSLNAERFAECVFYLETYASPEQLCSFFCRTGFMSRACAAVHEKQLAPAIFVETIVRFAVGHGVFAELLGHLKVLFVSSSNIMFELLSIKFFIFTKKKGAWRIHGILGATFARTLSLSCNQQAQPAAVWSPSFCGRLFPSRFLTAPQNPCYFMFLSILFFNFKKPLNTSRDEGITSVKFACDGELPLSRRKQYLRDAKSFFEQGLQSQVTSEDVSPTSTLRLFLSRAEAAKVGRDSRSFF